MTSFHTWINTMVAFSILEFKLFKYHKTRPFKLLVGPIIGAFIPIYQYKSFERTKNIDTIFRQYPEIDNVILFLVAGTLVGLMFNAVILRSGYVLNFERRQGLIEVLIQSPMSRVGYCFGRNSIITVEYFLYSTIIIYSLKFILDIYIPLTWFIYLIIAFIFIWVTSALVASFFIYSRAFTQYIRFIRPPVFLLSGLNIPRSIFPKFIYILSSIIPLTVIVDILRGGLVNIEFTVTMGIYYIFYLILLALITPILWFKIENQVAKKGNLGAY